ncbi:MAG: hypothetical protein B6U88_00815 [Candidatus Aenigmarchaeota archaeon ex4484_56]|nr:MAG: hypothetical protein B6U88_00815 [Candidatus Aenigmarchaeota archaeon ex4484_56]
MNKLFSASFVFTGTIIGAGILALPYYLSKTNILSGIFEILLVGGMMLIISLMFGEICLRTKEPHQLPGLCERYLGKKMKHLSTILSIFGMYGATIAYVEGSGTVISNLINISPGITKLLYFTILSSIIFFGIKGVEESEYFLTGLLIICIITISIASMLYFRPENLPTNIFSLKPLSVIVFAFSGMVAIPQMKEILWTEKRKLKKAIIIGFLIPMFIYIFFTISALGAVGTNIDSIATVSLAKYGISFLLLGYFFTLLATSTGYISICNAIREIYNQDYHINKFLSWLLACFPSITAIFGLANFGEILSITGGIFMTSTILLIIYLFEKIKKIGERQPEYSLKISNLAILIVALFFIYIIFQTILNI